MKDSNCSLNKGGVLLTEIVCDGSYKTITEAADVKNGNDEVNCLLRNFEKEMDNDKYLGICHFFIRDEEIQELLLHYMKQTFLSRRKNPGDTTSEKSESVKNDEYSISTDYDSEDESRSQKPSSASTTLKCPYCPKTLRGLHSLRNHCMRKHGNQNAKNVLCDKCPTLFFTDFEFNRHFQIHNCVKNFLCHLCSKKFVQKSTLELHLRYHVNDRRYQCSVCRKKFFTKNHLNRHCLIHTNRRDFKCVPCNRSFRYKDHLKRHLHNVHIGVRSHCCGQCHQSFTYLSQLRFHKRIHTECSLLDEPVQTKSPIKSKCKE